MSKPTEAWRARAATLRAIGLLLIARLLVAAVPLRRWRGRLGFAGSPGNGQRVDRLAGQVERGAMRLPLPMRCLPRAMALSWLLRRERIAHRVVIAIRPPDRRDDTDALHAWVEWEKTIVLGDLPGPWQELLSLPGTQ